MDPTPLLSQVYVGCTQCDSITTESHVKTKSDLIGKITTTRTEAKSQIKDTENRKVASWSNDSEGHAGKYLERFVKSAHKTVDQSSKVSRPCTDNPQFAKDDFEIVGESADVYATFLESLYVARIGPPDILWTDESITSSGYEMEQSETDKFSQMHFGSSATLSCWRHSQ